jgi:hypothetical protein
MDIRGQRVKSATVTYDSITALVNIFQPGKNTRFVNKISNGIDFKQDVLLGPSSVRTVTTDTTGMTNKQDTCMFKRGYHQEGVKLDSFANVEYAVINDTVPFEAICRHLLQVDSMPYWDDTKGDFLNCASEDFAGFYCQVSPDLVVDYCPLTSNLYGNQSLPCHTLSNAKSSVPKCCKDIWDYGSWFRIRSGLNASLYIHSDHDNWMTGNRTVSGLFRLTNGGIFFQDYTSAVSWDGSTLSTKSQKYGDLLNFTATYALQQYNQHVCSVHNFAWYDKGNGVVHLDSLDPVSFSFSTRTSTRGIKNSISIDFECVEELPIVRTNIYCLVTRQGKVEILETVEECTHDAFIGTGVSLIPLRFSLGLRLETINGKPICTDDEEGLIISYVRDTCSSGYAIYMYQSDTQRSPGTIGEDMYRVSAVATISMAPLQGSVLSGGRSQTWVRRGRGLHINDDLTEPARLTDIYFTCYNASLYCWKNTRQPFYMGFPFSENAALTDNNTDATSNIESKWFQDSVQLQAYQQVIYTPVASYDKYILFFNTSLLAYLYLENSVLRPIGQSLCAKGYTMRVGVEDIECILPPPQWRKLPVDWTKCHVLPGTLGLGWRTQCARLPYTSEEVRLSCILYFDNVTNTNDYYRKRRAAPVW